MRTQVIAQEVLLEKPVDKAPCPFCGEQILLTAIKCRFCNEFLDKQLSTTIAPQVLPPSLPSPQPIIQNVIHNTVVSTHAPRWNPGVAAILSFIIPGLGEMYKGQVLNGIIWLFLTTIGYVCFIVPGLVLHVCCIVGAASGNPNR
ncbi:hypothetical protein [Pirellula sp. SH-Sr6A]|uniref:hypothetical protein n=1 Tax=Pirellula sp. SH-Sr6A TaxID=1632865 RepID=UPI0011BA4E0B|nr:hypothetical protein [Pirellula sp. SH-Sr6A]